MSSRETDPLPYLIEDAFKALCEAEQLIYPGGGGPSGEAVRRRKQEGSYIVTGPAGEKRALSVSHGLSVAQDLATRHRREKGVFTYEITDLLGTTVYATVTKEEDGAILTWPKILAD